MHINHFTQSIILSSFFFLVSSCNHTLQKLDSNPIQTKCNDRGLIGEKSCYGREIIIDGKYYYLESTDHFKHLEGALIDFSGTVKSVTYSGGFEIGSAVPDGTVNYISIDKWQLAK